MKALILAAGYATRLYPLTKDTPKPLLKLGDRTILDHITEQLEQIEEIEKIYIVTNNKFYSHFIDWFVPKVKANLGHKYKLINDGSNTVEDRIGAIGDIYLTIEKEEINNDFIIIAGDNLFDFDINQFITFAQSRKPYHSMCLYQSTNNLDLKRFGLAQLNGNSEISDFDEKPESPKSNLIGTCIYFFPKEKLNLISEYLNAGHHRDTPGSYISWLIQKDRVYGRVYEGTWFDLGDFDSLSQAIVYLHSK